MLEKLKNFLRGRSSKGIALAYSGGVDSTLLLAVLKILFDEKPFPLAACTMQSVFQTPDEIRNAVRVAEKIGVVPAVFEYDPFSIPQVRGNTRERCYWCKKSIFSQFLKFTEAKGIAVLIDGTNFDDKNVFRPGRKALQELGVVSPLAELGFTKRDVRKLAKMLGLECASKPSAPCLATRFEYNVLLTDEKIRMVEKGEEILRKFLGAGTDLRLRVHGNFARIEVPPEHFSDIVAASGKIVPAICALGFSQVTLDLAGFRSGSMDDDKTVR